MSLTSANILIVDDDEDVLHTAKMLIKQYFSDVQVSKDPKNALELVKKHDFDVVLLDMNFSRGDNDGTEGIFWLDRIREIDPTISVIMITAYGEIELAVEAMKKGATEFVLKPWENQKFLATLQSSVTLRSSKKEIDKLRHTQKKISRNVNQPFENFIGRSPAMKRVFELIDKVASTDANVLVLGENGTGKELVARAIHNRSDRSEQSFMNIDLGSISETLFESELFGHKKGAFTDAYQDRPGSIELADKGSLFLDEIGNLSLSLQSKLLTVIQNRTIKRVGADRIIPVDIRLICATNQPLYSMVEENTFRRDLLYRINTVEIQLPPLRERVEDIPLLAEHFFRIYSQKYRKSDMTINDNVMDHLKSYDWPGNIRELQHAVERAVILSENTELVIGNFNFRANARTVSSPATEGKSLEELEKNWIMKSLDSHRGNVSHVARELGITRATLYRKMKRYNI